MKKLIVFAVCMLAGYALSGSVHSWTAGEYITANDLNAAIAHLHTNLGHGHGAIVVNADLSTGAAISHAKLATPALVPKAWVSLATTCVTTAAAAACASIDSAGSAVVTSTGTTDGEYTVTFPSRGDVNFGTLVTAHGVLDLMCHTSGHTATTASIKCATASTGAAADAAFTFMLLDS